MINVIVVNGFPRSGKDTFVDLCKEQLGAFGHSISTVDKIKELARSAGWNGEKTPEARRGLAEMKNLLSDWLDTPFKEIQRKIREIESDIIYYNLDEKDFYLFVFCREPKEIKRLVDEFDARTLLITRKAVIGEQSNGADANVLDYQYTYEIQNDGTIEDLKEMAVSFLNRLKVENCRNF